MPERNELLDLFDSDVAKKLRARGTIPSGVPDIEFLQTGIYMLDWAIGGGLPKSRISEISGFPGSGKTTTALIIAQHVISDGGRVAWFEAEEALDPQWMAKLGIPVEEVYWDENDSLKDTHFHIYHPPYLEKGLEDIRVLAPTSVYDLIIYDSIGGSPTLAAYEADVEKNQMTLTARVLGRFCSVMPQDIKKGKSAVLFTNQVYTDINQKYIDNLKPHGGTYVAKGGSGMAFLTTVRMMTYLPKMVKNTAGENLGKTIKARVYKNKVLGGIQRDFTYNIMHDNDYYIDVPQDIADTSLLLNVLDQRGPSWFYKGENVGVGIAKLKQRLTTDEELRTSVLFDLNKAIAQIRYSKLPATEYSELPDLSNQSIEEDTNE